VGRAEPHGTLQKVCLFSLLALLGFLALLLMFFLFNPLFARFSTPFFLPFQVATWYPTSWCLVLCFASLYPLFPTHTLLGLSELAL
jgi:uncharacterized membrane protein (GlpM family)